MHDGVSLISAEKTGGGVRLTLMIPDYQALGLAKLTLMAKTPAGPREPSSSGLRQSPVTADVSVAVKDAGGAKHIAGAASSVMIAIRGGLVGDVDGDGKLTLLDVSDIIDAFGIGREHSEWETKYQYFDYLNHGIIDIANIAHVASKI
jgi:hypothetical protein